MNAHRTIKTASVPTLLAGALLFAGSFPGALAAQEGTDGRWMPWLGCWEAAGAPAGASLLCILPMVGDVGVEMVAVEDGRVVSREWVRADGRMQESSREGCRGWERARFSEGGRRIYLDGDQLCEGTVRQESSGLIAMISRTEWIDVRALVVDGEVVTGVSRFTLAPADVAEAAGFGDVAADLAMAVRAGRMSAAAVLGVEDVIEASGQVHAEVVRAWIAERGEAFRLNAERLVRMADAGVAPDVIDVVVAVSYPRQFAIEGVEVSEVQAQRAGIDEPYDYSPRRGGFLSPFYPGYYSGGYYGGYGGGYRGGYGGYGGGFYGYPGFRPTVVVVQPREPQDRGRVVNGRGYTRSQSGSTAPAPSAARAPAPPRTSSPPPPTSSGSSGTSTGRTAVPRPPASGGGGGDGG